LELEDNKNFCVINLINLFQKKDTCTYRMSKWYFI